MRKAQYTVSGKDVQEHTAALLTSLVDAGAQMKDAPSGETARKALLATLPDYATLQKGVNRALNGDIPKLLRERRQRVAIDLHLVPYYGSPMEDPKEIYRSQAKAGTHNFHAYATPMSCFMANVSRWR